MKKKILFVAAFFVCCGTWMNNVNDVNIDDLLLENIDAMADSEASVGPFCIVTKDVCFTEPGGLFIKGYRLYF